MTQVSLSVSEDKSQPFGYAQIVFPRQIGNSPRLRLAITRRSPDKPHLGETGWQARPASVEARVVGRDDSSTIVVVGPEVCEQIPVDTKVRIEAEGYDVWGDAHWPAVTASPGKWTGALEKPRAKVPDVIEKKVAPPPAPPPPQVVKPPESPKQQPAPPPSPPPVPPAKRKRPLLYTIPLLLILLAVGWYATIGESLAEKFERLKRTDNEGDELLALSAEAYEAGDRDIGQKAILLSYDRGYTEAKLQLARLYDPRLSEPGKLDGAADANKAGRFYFELAIEEYPGAKDLLTDLCEESRNSGSPHAADFVSFQANIYCEGTLGQ